jgi:hypothetical protein
VKRAMTPPSTKPAPSTLKIMRTGCTTPMYAYLTPNTGSQHLSPCDSGINIPRTHSYFQEPWPEQAGDAIRYASTWQLLVSHTADHNPGDPAPETGRYEEYDVPGDPTGRIVHVNEGEPLPGHRAHSPGRLRSAGTC